MSDKSDRFDMAAVFLSVAGVQLPIAYGAMVCRHFNTGNVTHSKDPIPDSP